MQTIQFGEHITLDGYHGNSLLLGDKETVESILRNLPEELGMHPLSEPFVISAPDNGLNDPGGYTGFVIIAESHISIHTFPKRGFVSADVYTCKNGMDKEAIIESFTKAFQLKDVEVNLIKRGTRYPIHNLYTS